MKKATSQRPAAHLTLGLLIAMQALATHGARAAGMGGLITQVDASGDGAATAPADPKMAQQAVQFLRSKNVGVSYDSLTQAISASNVEIVAALLDAGLQVGPDEAARVSGAAISGLATACQPGAIPEEHLDKVLEILVNHGLPIGYADKEGNTILLSAAQFCPASVTDRIITLGAPVDPVNKQHFTPLMMAFVSGKWDVAKVLVDHGARVTQDQANQLFFEPPKDPDQRALLARATH